MYIYFVIIKYLRVQIQKYEKIPKIFLLKRPLRITRLLNTAKNVMSAGILYSRPG